MPIEGFGAISNYISIATTKALQAKNFVVSIAKEGISKVSEGFEKIGFGSFGKIKDEHNLSRSASKEDLTEVDSKANKFVESNLTPREKKEAAKAEREAVGEERYAKAQDKKSSFNQAMDLFGGMPVKKQSKSKRMQSTEKQKFEQFEAAVKNYQSPGAKFADLDAKLTECANNYPGTDINEKKANFLLAYFENKSIENLKTAENISEKDVFTSTLKMLKNFNRHLSDPELSQKINQKISDFSLESKQRILKNDANFEKNKSQWLRDMFPSKAPTSDIKESFMLDRDERIGVAEHQEIIITLIKLAPSTAKKLYKEALKHPESRDHQMFAAYYEIANGIEPK